MIYTVLKLLSNQLNAYFKSLEKPSGLDNIPIPTLKNIALLEEDELKTSNNIFLTLVNLSEEAALKNNPSFTRKSNDTIAYHNPPINLNLFVLVSVCMSNYDHALIYLGHTINYFQGKYIFNPKNTVSDEVELPDNYYFILDINTLTFEQSNYLWSTLGGKQHPFICYKVRLLEMERESTREMNGVINEVTIDGRNKV